MIQLFTIYVAVRSFFFPICSDKKHNDFTNAKRHYKISQVARIDDALDECSGLQKVPGKDLLYAINDGGNGDKLFIIDYQGKLIDKEHVKDSKNVDWEDITIDEKGRVYIGDFGNNQNKRKNLKIYKLNKSLNAKEDLEFKYKDQDDYPPKKDKMDFDCEAMAYKNDRLYLISKNRGTKRVKLYELDADDKKQKADIISTIRLKGMITGADISPDGKELVLLSYGFIYFFDISQGVNFDKPTKVLYYGRLGQSEGITYVNDNELFIANENRKLFWLRKE